MARVASLEVGREYSYEYNNCDLREDTFIFDGFTVHKNGSRKIEDAEKFNSLAEVKKFLGAKNLAEIEDHDEYSTYMNCKNYGDVFYLFNGKWSRGSGADAMRNITEV